MSYRTYWDYLASNGQTYQMGAQPQRIYLLDLLCGLKDTPALKIEAARSLLDVGCGTGPIYELLKFDSTKPDRKWDVIERYKGTDYAEEMINVCKKEFPEGEWECEDARFLNEKTDSFDAVLLLHCLDHLDDYRAAIKEAHRVAKKYVCIVLWRPLTTNGMNNLNNRNSYGRESGEWEDTHLQEFSEDKLVEAFREAGLTLLLKKDDKEINPDGKANTLFLLKVTGVKKNQEIDGQTQVEKDDEKEQ